MGHHQKKSDLIVRFLTPAIKLWLRSQLDSLADCTINIDAGDREIFKGKINSVKIETKQAIYRGIYINQVSVNTANIEINLGGILRGKPLRLLHPIYVLGEVNLNENDLQKSLKSSLLKQGLQDFLKLLLEHEGVIETSKLIGSQDINWQSIKLENEYINLCGITNNTVDKINIKTRLIINNNQKLLFDSLHIQGIKKISHKTINNFVINLGDDVELKNLTIDKNSLLCQGKIKVIS